MKPALGFSDKHIQSRLSLIAIFYKTVKSPLICLKINGIDDLTARATLNSDALL